MYLQTFFFFSVTLCKVPTMQPKIWFATLFVHSKKTIDTLGKKTVLCLSESPDCESCRSPRVEYWLSHIVITTGSRVTALHFTPWHRTMGHDRATNYITLHRRIQKLVNADSCPFGLIWSTKWRTHYEHNTLVITSTF